MLPDVAYLALLLLSGTNLSLTGQVLAHAGPAKTSRVDLLVQFLVQLVFLAPSLASTRDKPTRRQLLIVLLISVFYVAGFALSFAAVARAGAALNQIIYSTGLVFMAVLSYLVLGKVPSSGESFGMAVAFAGVAVASSDAIAAAYASLVGGSAGGGDAVAGLLLSVANTLSFNLTGVLIEALSRVPKAKPLSAAFVQLCQVTLGVLAFAIYVSLVTVPRWDELVTKPVAARGNSLFYVLGLYVFNGLCSLLHSQLYIKVARSTFGATGTSLVNAVRTASVIVAAHVFLGDSLTPTKVVGALLIAVGGAVFVVARSAPSTKPKPKPKPVRAPRPSRRRDDLAPAGPASPRSRRARSPRPSSASPGGVGRRPRRSAGPPARFA